MSVWRAPSRSPRPNPGRDAYRYASDRIIVEQGSGIPVPIASAVEQAGAGLVSASPINRLSESQGVVAAGPARDGSTGRLPGLSEYRMTTRFNQT